jgi:hypothetical protein
MTMLMSSALPAMREIFADTREATETAKKFNRRSLKRKDIEQKTVGTMFQVKQH